MEEKIEASQQKEESKVEGGESALVEHSSRYVYYRKLKRETRITRVLSLLRAERGEESVVGEMGLEREEWEEVKREALEEEGRRLGSRSKEEIYAQYVIAQSACVRDLMEVKRKGKANAGQNAAWVSAVKARSEIFDRIIKMGWELGLVERREVEESKGKGTEVNVGVVLSGLSDVELRGKVVRELSNLNDIMEEFGEKDILELKPGRMYTKMVTTRKNPTDSNRVHSGAGVNRRSKGGA